MKTLKIENLKGKTESYELGKVNLLTGGSGAGKSTLIQAFTFLAAGYLIDNGNTYKKAEEIFKLSSGNSMSVGYSDIENSFQRGIDRKVKQTLEGQDIKYTKTADVSNKYGEKTVTQLADRITSDFGIHESVLNFSTFSNLSAEEQRKFIFSIYPIDKEKWTQENIAEYLVHKLAGVCDDTALEVINSVADVCINNSVNEALNGVKKEYNALNKTNSENEIKLKGLLEIKQADEESVRGLVALQERKKEYTDKLESLSKEVANGFAQNEKKLEHDADIEVLRNEIEYLKSTITASLDSQHELESKLEELKKRKISLDTSEVDFKISNLQIEAVDIGETKLKLLEEIKTLDSQTNEYLKKFTDQESRVKVARENVAKSTSIYEGLKATIEKLSRHDGTCPLNCKVKCNTDMSIAVADLTEELERNELLLNELKSQLAIEIEMFDSLKNEKEKNEEQLDSLLNQNEKLRLLIEKNANLLREQESLRQSIVSEYEKNSRDLAVEIENISGKINTVVSLIENYESRRNLKQSSLDEMIGIEYKVIDVEKLQSDVDVIKHHISETDIKIAEKIKAKTNLENLAKFEAEASVVKEKWQTYKYLVEAMGKNGLSGQMIVEAITPMIKEIQYNLDVLIGGVEFYVDTDNFNFGWIKDGQKRSYETLSGGETLVMTTAMIIEFMQNTCKFKALLIDEVNHADSNLAEKFIEGVTKLSDKYDLCMMAANYIDNAEIKKLSSIENLNLIDMN